MEIREDLKGPIPQMEAHDISSLFPLMSDEELRALTEDIRKNGLLEPIEVYEGKILDGRNRLKACQLAGVEARFVDWKGAGSPVAYVVSKNLYRRHLTSDQRATIAVDMLPHLEEEAKKRQAEGVKLGGRGHKKENSVVPGTTEFIGRSRDQVARAAGVRCCKVSEAKRVKNESPDLFNKVRAGEKTLTQAKRELGLYVDKERKSPRLVSQFTGVEIRRGDFREVLADVPDMSVKCVFTDPPYGKDYLGLWDDLGMFASRVLSPDGLLIAYSGQMYLPEVISCLSKHLSWWWLCGVAHKGNCNLSPLGYPVRKVINRFKPLLVFIPKNGIGINVVFNDLIAGTGSDKTLHNWQQPVEEAYNILHTFCVAGDTVIDPFAGTGAFGEAAKLLGLNFLGAEIIDEEQHKESKGF